MKKILLVALALTLGFSTYAQMQKEKTMRCANGPQFSAVQKTQAAAKDATPVWSPIGSHFTATDINGNTVSSEAILNSGKAILIDYSAVWCSWCWVMHTNGILEAIQEQLGNDVYVIWVEADPSTGSTGITAAGGVDQSQGDWTNGGTVTYPIIDDPNTTCLVGGSSAIEGFPSVFFVSPTGFFCSVYGEEWGFGPYTASTAVTAVQNLLDIYPQAGDVPQVSLNGPTVAFIDVPVNFTFNIASVEDYEYDIDAEDGEITMGTNGFSVVWSEAGDKEVTLTATNENGDNTATVNVHVRDGWEWGDEMSYCGNDEVESNIGMGGSGAITWGIKIPAVYMEGRNYVQNVKLYISNPGEYTLSLLEGTSDASQNQIYQWTYNVTESDAWHTFNPIWPVELDETKDLWVVFSTDGVSYPASYSEFCGDFNSSYIYYDGAWYYIQTLAESLNPTWMIKVTTGDDATALSTAINGPSAAKAGNTVSFTAAGPENATYAWTLNGANPATANTQTANATWSEAGDYTISVTVTYNGATASASHTINIANCDVTNNLPYQMGFEANESVDCIEYIDQDGDGVDWMLGSVCGLNGVVQYGADAMFSSSYINNYGPLTPDNIIVIAKVHIPAGGAYIEWYDYGVDQSYFAEHYAVYVSTNNSSFSNPVWEGNIASGQTWKKHGANITGYDNQDVYIAFRHYNVTDQFWMGIDNVKVAAGSTQGIDGVVESNVAIFPNPATSMVNVSAEGLQNVEVYDMSGRKVMTTTESSIDMSNFSNGVYMFRVTTTSGINNMKVIKK